MVAVVPRCIRGMVVTQTKIKIYVYFLYHVVSQTIAADTDVFLISFVYCELFMYVVLWCFISYHLSMHCIPYYYFTALWLKFVLSYYTFSSSQTLVNPKTACSSWLHLMKQSINNVLQYPLHLYFNEKRTYFWENAFPFP